MKSDFTLNVRLYNEAPCFMSIRLDDEIFVEPYHKGITKEAEDRSTAKCLGRAIQVVRTNLSSNLGQVTVSQFARLWVNSQSRQFQAGTSTFLTEELKKDWFGAYKKRLSEDDKELTIPGSAPDLLIPSKGPQSVSMPLAGGPGNRGCPTRAPFARVGSKYADSLNHWIVGKTLGRQ